MSEGVTSLGGGGSTRYAGGTGNTYGFRGGNPLSSNDIYGGGGAGGWHPSAPVWGGCGTDYMNPIPQGLAGGAGRSSNSAQSVILPNWFGISAGSDGILRGATCGGGSSNTYLGGGGGSGYGAGAGGASAGASGAGANGCVAVYW